MSARANRLHEEIIEDLRAVLLEAERTTNRQNPRFLEPRKGALRTATSNRSIVVFGRRGSGKTSLLSKAENEITTKSVPAVWVDLETYKDQQYPDLLISVLADIFGEFEKWLQANPDEVQPLKILGIPFGRSRETVGRAALVRDLAATIEDLEGTLAQRDNSHQRTKRTQREGNENRVKAEAGASTGGFGGRATTSHTSNASLEDVLETEEQYNKLDYITRKKRDLYKLLSRLVATGNGRAHLFMDDLYHLDRVVQPHVMDYFHSLSKGNNLFLKVGTIKHRSLLYKQEGQPIGVEIGHDISDVDLDLSLEEFNNTKRFLFEILQSLANECGLSDSAGLFTDGAKDRLVLASGGVARDFIRLVGKALERAQNDARVPASVDAEHVNQAAGALAADKRIELERDAINEREEIEDEYERILSFCLDLRNTNCFLFDNQAGNRTAELVQELADLRLIHKIHSAISTPHRKRKKFDAYVVDLGEYTGDRVRRGLNVIEFWKKSQIDQLRKVSMVYEPWEKDYRSELAQQGAQAKKGRLAAQPIEEANSDQAKLF